MKQPVSSVIAVLSALALSGCGGSAVMIFRTAHGGMLGLEGDRQQAIVGIARTDELDADRQFDSLVGCAAAHFCKTRRYRHRRLQ